MLIFPKVMKRILIITNDNRLHIFCPTGTGGGYVVTKNLIETLADSENTDLTVMSADTNSYDYKGIHFVNFDFGNFSEDKINELEQYIQNGNFDCVLTLNLYQMYKNPFLQSHSIAHRCLRSMFPVNIIRKFLSRKKIEEQKFYFSYSDKNSKFFAMSETIKKDYVKNLKLNTDNVYVVYPGCKQVYENCPKTAKNDRITFGIIAGSSLNKGGHLFILVMGIVKLLGFDFKINMISPKYGKDFVMKGIVRLFGLEKHLNILPFQSDMTNFYRNIDVLALPSLNEAFGLVVPEAMSFGHVCLVSSTAGSAEIIKNGENGFVFNRNSVFDFIFSVRKIIKLYNDDFEKFSELSENAFETSKIYTWKNFALNIINKF